AGIDIAPSLAEPARPDRDSLAQAAGAAGLRAASGDDWDAIFFKAFLERVEPHLGHPRPTFLTDYPIHMAALSRPQPGAPQLADRFELYAAGLELANAFGELTDPAEQRRRFEQDMDLKQRLYGTRYPIDEDFLAALEHGLPESAGIALGLDRLVMLATGAAHIEDVLWLPVADGGAGQT
ncbi:MAG: EF-P lysine aminoacylase GenX, partial [Alphaproteobacteria bacterium]|nr:EF-P lysine aminoacylase GenX [Alphaproteobacteria bacterium]